MERDWLWRQQSSSLSSEPDGSGIFLVSIDVDICHISEFHGHN